MSIKKVLMAFIQPYIVELILSKVFSRSKRFAFQQMDNALEDIREYLIEKKKAFKTSPNKLDEEVLNLGVSGLREFSSGLNRVLEEVQDKSAN